MSASLPPINDFDTLRREATKLERNLEDRISKYQQLAQRITTTDTGISGAFHTTGSNSISHPSSLESGTMSTNISVLFAEETSLSNDIDRLLSSFSDLQASMTTAANQTGKSQHSILVKRYREILFDFQSDYNKVKHAIQRRKETMELFSMAGKGSTSLGVSSGSAADSDMEHLLRERNSIQSSMNMTTNILGQADDIHADLRNQRRTLTGVGGTVLGIAQAVPGLNKLIENIRKKRNQDDKIVMAVIASCILFTLWYLFG
jgi:Golgi SNAP receptor complex protein 1